MSGNPHPSGVPKDASVMAGILKDLGVTDYEPRVVSQMLEFSYRYVSDILEDAKVFSEHAEKKSIDEEDVKLAIQNRADTTFSRPPPREFIADLAKDKNSIPLSPVKQQYGLRLPPDRSTCRYCQLQPNYRLRTRYPSVSETSAAAGKASPAVVPPSSHHSQSDGFPQVNTAGASGSSGSGLFRLATTGDVGAKKRKRDSTLDEDYDM